MKSRQQSDKCQVSCVRASSDQEDIQGSCLDQISCSSGGLNLCRPLMRELSKNGKISLILK